MSLSNWCDLVKLLAGKAMIYPTQPQCFRNMRAILPKQDQKLKYILAVR